MIERSEKLNLEKLFIEHIRGGFKDLSLVEKSQVISAIQLIQMEGSLSYLNDQISSIDEWLGKIENRIPNR